MNEEKNYYCFNCGTKLRKGHLLGKDHIVFYLCIHKQCIDYKKKIGYLSEGEK